MLRRDFLKTVGLGSAAIAMPTVPTIAAAKSVDSTEAVITRKAANAKINIGFIGCGQQACNLVRGFLTLDDVKIIAGCDLYDIKRNRFEGIVTDYYKEKGDKKPKCDMYEDYPDLLARKDIDAVVIATPDHYHAIVAIAAAKAGKDIYLEKPLTLTIYEGKQLCKAVRKYGVILQVGSMQRSYAEFDKLAQIAREGLLGEIEKIQINVGRNAYNPNNGAPVPYSVELADKNSRVKDPHILHDCPAGLNWDKWLGPLPTTVKYHHDFNPTIDEKGRDTCWGTWRWFQVSGGGLMTDWGAHMFDIAQWCMGQDNFGGVSKIYPDHYKQYPCLTYEYANGTVMTEEVFDDKHAGIRVWGENGCITVHRGSYETDNDKFAFTLPKSNGMYEIKTEHYRNFIDAVRAHVDPLVPVETGHTSNIVCCVGNICMEMHKPLVWNPIVQKFIGANADEANAKMAYKYRDAYAHSLDLD